MAKGWIKLYRQSEDNELYFSEPFDRWHAWQDLLLLVNHEEKTFFSKGQMITLKPGQTITSIAILAKRWKWSDNKVRRFIRQLNGSTMCTTSGTPNGTLITIVNWAKFQGEGQTGGSTDGRTDGRANGRTDGTLTRSIKNDKNTKNARARGVYFENNQRKDDLDGDVLKNILGRLNANGEITKAVSGDE